MTIPVPEPPFDLPPTQKALYEQVVKVLDRHLGLTRSTPLTGDLIEQTLQSFQALEDLVAPLRMPQYDEGTAEGRLMQAIALLNQKIPGVALRTLWHLHEYLATSDDDGVRTREKALGILQDLGLPEGDAARRSRSVLEPLMRTFPPLP